MDCTDSGSGPSPSTEGMQTPPASTDVHEPHAIHATSLETAMSINSRVARSARARCSSGSPSPAAVDQNVAVSTPKRATN
ncbi:MAG: hypothetical protein JWN46_81 [Acidimicrobiales bacterium]|nr:hypothetical protein [Acidimicrobiales bacterium]